MPLINSVHGKLDAPLGVSRVGQWPGFPSWIDVGVAPATESLPTWACPSVRGPSDSGYLPNTGCSAPTRQWM